MCERVRSTSLCELDHPQHDLLLDGANFLCHIVGMLFYVLFVFKTTPMVRGGVERYVSERARSEVYIW